MTAPDLVHPVPKLRLVEDRIGLLRDLARGKRVLHLGCTQSPTTASSWAAGTLVHRALMDGSASLVGVDLDADAVKLLESRGVGDLIVGDVERLHETGLKADFDLVVAGEIIEHLSNPGLCFRGSHDLLKPGGKLVVTVPNAFSLRHFVSLLTRRIERVMPDHTAYYSVSTMRELLRRHGFRTVDIVAYSLVENVGAKRAAKRALNRSVLRMAPQVAEGLIFVAERD